MRAEILIEEDFGARSQFSDYLTVTGDADAGVGDQIDPLEGDIVVAICRANESRDGWRIGIGNRHLDDEIVVQIDDEIARSAPAAIFGPGDSCDVTGQRVDACQREEKAFFGTCFIDPDDSTGSLS